MPSGRACAVSYSPGGREQPGLAHLNELPRRIGSVLRMFASRLEVDILVVDIPGYSDTWGQASTAALLGVCATD